MGKKNKRNRNERKKDLQRLHNKRRNEKLKNKEYINKFPKLNDINLKFIWNVECIKCRKILYPVNKIPIKSQIPKGYVYGFQYDNDNIGIVPIDFIKCGEYDKTNIEWTCFDCK